MARDYAITKVSTEKQPQLADDIFQAAMVASEQDSDGDDPYGPQPKRFMQTEHQKRQHARDLEIRRAAYTIRKMKKTHKADHQRLKKQKQRGSAIEKLPTDLILMLMQHTHWRNINNFSNISAINRSIFQANRKAIFRGMETEQFPEWEWFFGNSKRRTPAQAQHLKDAMTMTFAHGWVSDDRILEIFQMIDQSEFTGMRNTMFLQGMQDNLDMEHRAIESYTGRKVSRRTAMCLSSLGFQRLSIVTEENRTEDKPSLQYVDLPWDARCQLVNEQPASIQAEIRLVLKIVVERYGDVLQDEVAQWIEENQSSSVYQQNPGVLKKWMSKLMAGLVLEALIPTWRIEALESAPSNWDDSILDLSENLGEILDEYDGGNVNVINHAAKDGVEFGKRIGLELEGFLDGTLAGEAFDAMALTLESAES
ncbi:hypothetical protein BDR22DRAFT_959490 [Usnea florida]